MNHSTCKLIHTFSTLNGFREGEVKKHWHQLSWLKRAQFRQKMKESVQDKLWDLTFKEVAKNENSLPRL
jgi:hypothetical protein